MYVSATVSKNPKIVSQPASTIIPPWASQSQSPHPCNFAAKASPSASMAFWVTGVTGSRNSCLGGHYINDVKLPWLQADSPICIMHTNIYIYTYILIYIHMYNREIRFMIKISVYIHTHMNTCVCNCSKMLTGVLSFSATSEWSKHKCGEILVTTGAYLYGKPCSYLVSFQFHLPTWLKWMQDKMSANCGYRPNAIIYGTS